jgi:hypothetical protein
MVGFRSEEHLEGRRISPCTLHGAAIRNPVCLLPLEPLPLIPTKTQCAGGVVVDGGRTLHWPSSHTCFQLQWHHHLPRDQIPHTDSKHWYVCTVGAYCQAYPGESSAQDGTAVCPDVLLELFILGPQFWPFFFFCNNFQDKTQWIESEILLRFSIPVHLIFHYFITSAFTFISLFN